MSQSPITLPATAALTDTSLPMEARATILDTRPGLGVPGNEAVIGVINYLPVRYLRDGAERARSVCRVVLGNGSGYGSGFLVAPRVILTNHHVLAKVSDASQAMLEFDHEQGTTPVRVQLMPEVLFHTNEDLDYTIVACAEVPGERTPIPLLRDGTTIAAGEHANIVQHPRGGFKQVVLHDNVIQDIGRKLIWYSSDTEPGSSGSPVFNDQWQVVALHHFADTVQVTDPNSGVTRSESRNRGIRVAAIVNDLVQKGLTGTKRTGPLVDAVKGADPRFGLFDRAGLPGEEIQVDTYDGANFLDVGFWNIEWFSGADIADARIRKVADVLRTLSLDALGLEEVGKSAMTRLVARAREIGLELGLLFHDASPNNEQDHAILFDRRTTVAKKDEAAYTRHKTLLGAVASNGKAVFPRSPLLAEVTIGVDDPARATTFLMVVVHLKAKVGGEAQTAPQRRAAAEALVALVAAERAANPKRPVVIGGDFNDELTNATLAPLLGTPGMVALTQEDAKAPGVYSYLASPHSLIDHVVVTSDLAVDKSGADDLFILRLDHSVEGFVSDVSDHAPVVFRLVAGGNLPQTVTPETPPSEGVTVAVPPGTAAVEMVFRR